MKFFEISPNEVGEYQSQDLVCIWTLTDWLMEQMSWTMTVSEMPPQHTVWNQSDMFCYNVTRSINNSSLVHVSPIQMSHYWSLIDYSLNYWCYVLTMQPSWHPNETIAKQFYYSLSRVQAYETVIFNIPLPIAYISMETNKSMWNIIQKKSF